MPETLMRLNIFKESLHVAYEFTTPNIPQEKGIVDQMLNFHRRLAQIGEKR
jgi:hypothetical protein